MDNCDEQPPLTAKERARQQRRLAYKKAKAAMLADPKNQARKEAARLKRREIYQRLKNARQVQDQTRREQAKAVSRTKLRESAPEKIAALTALIKRGSDLVPKALKATELSETRSHLRLVRNEQDDKGS